LISVLDGRMLKRLTLRRPAAMASANANAMWLLPTELLLIIFKYLPQKDWLPLLYTCRRMRTIVEPLLYMDIVIPPQRRRHAVSELLRTLDHRTELPGYVYSFDGFIRPMFSQAAQPLHLRESFTPTRTLPWSTKHYTPNEKEFDQLLIRVLSKTHNLRSLCLRDSGLFWRLSCSKIIHAITRLPITSLTLMSQEVMDSGYLIPHIRQLPLLERFEFRSSHLRIGSIPPDCMPRVKHLVSCPEDAMKIVPGRPVSSLGLVIYKERPYQTPMDWSSLTASAMPIKRLTIVFEAEHQTIDTVLGLAATYGGHVEELILKRIQYGGSFFHALHENVPRFRSLRTLRIEDWDPTGMPSLNPQELDGALVEHCRTACPGLQDISASR